MAKRKRLFGGSIRRKQAAVRKLVNLRRRGKLAHSNWGDRKIESSCPVAAIADSRSEVLATRRYRQIVGLPENLVDLFIMVYDKLYYVDAIVFAVQFHRAMSLNVDPGRVDAELKLLMLEDPLTELSAHIPSEVGKKALALVLTLVRRQAAGIKTTKVEEESALHLLIEAKKPHRFARLYNLEMQSLRVLDYLLEHPTRYSTIVPDLYPIRAPSQTSPQAMLGFSRLFIQAVHNGKKH